MDRLEYEMMLEQTLKAVSKQYLVPVELAIGTITAAICCSNAETSKAVAALLRAQAEACRQNDLAGWVLLERMANIADAPPAFEPDPSERAARNTLKLIWGGKSPPQGEL